MGGKGTAGEEEGREVADFLAREQRKAYHRVRELRSSHSKDEEQKESLHIVDETLVNIAFFSRISISPVFAISSFQSRRLLSL